MVTILYLIRHGETEGSETKRYKGSIDVPLSEKGLDQIKGSSAFIKEYLGNMSSSKYLSYLKDIHRSSEDSAEARKSESPDPTSELQSFRTSRLQAVYSLQSQQGCQER